jgi:hypothetical protein
MHRQEIRDRPAPVRRLVVGDDMDLFAARLIDWLMLRWALR